MDSLNLFRADLLVKKNVGTATDREKLLSQIRAEQHRQPNGVDWSNTGCWRSQMRYPNLEWLVTEIREMLGWFADEYAVEFANKALDHTKINYFYWTNVNQPKSKNTKHSHVKAHFSAVYYLQGTDTGAIRMSNPANILGNCDHLAPYVTDVGYAPNDGDLILWPAWVPHEVETNFSDRERINITFDINLHKLN